MTDFKEIYPNRQKGWILDNRYTVDGHCCTLWVLGDIKSESGKQSRMGCRWNNTPITLVYYWDTLWILVGFRRHRQPGQAATWLHVALTTLRTRFRNVIINDTTPLTHLTLSRLRNTVSVLIRTWTIFFDIS